MDANLIYEKTPAGEEAVRQRTRVVQRNTRMVLILVDGKSTVGDLCGKTGNAQLVETALQDLESDGLIALRLEQDSVWEQSRKLGEEIKAAAISRLAREVSLPPPAAEPAGAPESLPPSLPPSPSPSPPPAQPEAAGEPPSRQQPDPVPSVLPMMPEPAPVSLAPVSIYPDQPAASFAPVSDFSPSLGGPSIAPQTGGAPRAATEAADVPGRLAALFSRKQRARDDDAAAPIRRGGRGPYVSLPLAVALGVVGTVLLAALVFLLYPYDSHRPQFEAALSRLAGQPVRIAEVRAGFLPRPAISLEGVSGGEGLQAKRIRLVPEVFSLLGSRPAFSSVEIESAHLSAGALAALPKALVDAMAAGAPATVRAVGFSQLEVDILGLPISDLHAEVRPGDEAAVFQSGDRSLKIAVKSQPAGFVADFEGYGWRPQADSRFRFDSLQGQAIWDGRVLAIRSLDARIFDGAVQGSLLLDAAKQPSLAGDLTVKHMNVLRLAVALGYGNQFEGELVGALKFSGQAPAWAGVLAAASGDGDFAMQRGALGGFDLVEAVRRGKGEVRGGTTRFEHLNGRLKISPESVRFADLSLASGLLRAGGYLDVARDGKLTGRLDVEMRGSASVVRMPLVASSSLQTPVLSGR